MKNLEKLETGKLKKVKQTKRILLPESIDLDLLVSELPQKPRKYKENPKLKRDEFAYIIYIILLRIAYKRKQYEKRKFVGFHSKELEEYSRDYSSIMSILEKNQIIEIDHFYLKEETTKGYAFCEGILSTELSEYIITTKKFIKKKFENEKEKSNEAPHIEALIFWLKELTIEEHNAIECLKNMYEQKNLNILNYYQNRVAILNIVHKQWYFIIDQSAGRVHTTITSLKKELREYLNIRGKRLKETDISNCQPLVSLTLFHKELRIKYKIDWTITSAINLYNTRKGDHDYINRHSSFPFLPSNIDDFINKNDVRIFIRLVSKGKLYKFLLNKYNWKFPRKKLDLKRLKKNVIACLFSPSAWNSTIVKLLRLYFPNVINVFDHLKIGFTKTSNGKGFQKRTAFDPPCLLAILLQSLEANLVIHQIVPDIIAKNSDIPIITIHDAILSFPEHEKLIKEIMDKRIHEITDSFGSITKVEMEEQLIH
ncbi:MAG: hypothetical protein IPM48_14300 [Saprospiraceae bacterium]|nr:hypothetical protein [Saprospiraceae bacterium]